MSSAREALPERYQEVTEWVMWNINNPKYKYADSRSGFTFNFGDIIYRINGRIIELLDNPELLGWTWKPPQEFIDRVMKGGMIRFSSTGLERFTLPEEKMGDLWIKVKNSDIEDKFAVKIDPADVVCFNDNHVKSKPLFEKAPAEFIQRMYTIVREVVAHYNEKKADSIVLPSHPDYIHAVIPKPPEVKLSYRSQFMKQLWQEREKRGVKSSNYFSELWEQIYHIASNIHFFSLNKDDKSVIVDLSVTFESVGRYSHYSHSWKTPKGCENIRAELTSIFGKLGIYFDEAKENSYQYRISEESLECLKALGGVGQIIYLNKIPTFKDKAAVAFGFMPESIDVTDDKVTADFGNGSHCSMTHWMEQEKIIRDTELHQMSGYGVGGCEYIQKGVGKRFLEKFEDIFLQNRQLIGAYPELLTPMKEEKLLQAKELTSSPKLLVESKIDKLPEQSGFTFFETRPTCELSNDDDLNERNIHLCVIL